MSDELLDSLATLLTASGRSVEDLAAHMRSKHTDMRAPAPTIAEHVDAVLKVLKKGTARGYRTHFLRLVNGVGPQCTCTCRLCIEDFADHAECRNRCGRCKDALRFEAAGERRLLEGCVNRNELEVLAVIAERMSKKKAMVNNLRRAARGQSAKPGHGQGGREMCVAALRCLFERAIPDHIKTNPAEKIGKGKRSESRRRALSDDELTEVLHEVVSAGDDPELDLALVWAELETGARRGGVTSLAMGRLNPDLLTIKLFEKGDRERAQPVTQDFMDFVLDHAARRGGTRCVPGHRDFDPNAPCLYFADSTPENPHPVTSRRFDTLHKRLQLALPWANDMMFSGHALRHTSATVIERIAGTQVARKFLGHGKRRTTDTYTDASELEVAEAFSKMTGRPHPMTCR